MWNAPAGLSRPSATSPLPVAARVPARTTPAPAREPVRTSAAGLRAVREADLRRAVERVASGGAPIRVGRYTLVTPLQDPAARLAETQSVALRRGWQAVITAFDTGADDPASRPHLARLITALSTEEIHGIVAVSQVDISAHHDTYADILAVLRARGGFLALARAETSI